MSDLRDPTHSKYNNLHKIKSDGVKNQKELHLAKDPNKNGGNIEREKKGGIKRDHRPGLVPCTSRQHSYNFDKGRGKDNTPGTRSAKMFQTPHQKKTGSKKAFPSALRGWRGPGATQKHHWLRGSVSTKYNSKKKVARTPMDGLGGGGKIGEKGNGNSLG